VELFIPQTDAPKTIIAIPHLGTIFDECGIAGIYRKPDIARNTGHAFVNMLSHAVCDPIKILGLQKILGISASLGTLCAKHKITILTFDIAVSHGVNAIHCLYGTAKRFLHDRPEFIKCFFENRPFSEVDLFHTAAIVFLCELFVFEYIRNIPEIRGKKAIGTILTIIEKCGIDTVGTIYEIYSLVAVRGIHRLVAKFGVEHGARVDYIFRKTRIVHIHTFLTSERRRRIIVIFPTAPTKCVFDPDSHGIVLK
jgi:hypothetical protein